MAAKSVVQVDLTNFPDLNNISIARSLGIPDVGTSSPADAVQGVAAIASHTADSAAHKVDQHSAYLQNIADGFNLHLPAFYAVGLWGYCEGQQAVGSFSQCSDPSVSFSFDLLGLFRSLSNDVNKLVPQGSGKALAGYSVVSRWSIWAYVLGFTSTVLAIVFGVVSIVYSRGRILLLLCCIVSSGEQLLVHCVLTLV